MGRRKKEASKMGKALIKDRFRGKTVSGGGESFLHTTELNDGWEGRSVNLQSMTEPSSMSDFLMTAQMAGRDFAAEKENVQLVTPQLNSGVLSSEKLKKVKESQDQFQSLLRIPRRPPWDESTPADKLRQDEQMAFLEWRRQLARLQEEEHIVITPYEKNLEFWRQLWRVIERSDVVVQIVDARNPLLFWCPDLDAYVREVDPHKQTLLLLNKADLLTQAQRQAWAEYFASQGVDVVFWSAVEEAARLDSKKSAATTDIDRHHSSDDDGDDDDDDDDGDVDDESEDKETEDKNSENDHGRECAEHLTHPEDAESCDSTQNTNRGGGSVKGKDAANDNKHENKDDKNNKELNMTPQKSSAVEHSCKDADDDVDDEEACEDDDDDDNSDDYDTIEEYTADEDEEEEEEEDGAGDNRGIQKDGSSRQMTSEASGRSLSSEVTPCDQPATTDKSRSSQLPKAADSRLKMSAELLDLFREAAGRGRKQEEKEKEEGGDRERQGGERVRTVGLVGYPNVGKSSTINTILQHKKVAVSATPGRTKHFQTLYVDRDLMLCDCPGLVFPSFVNSKADLVVNGVLPIDQLHDSEPPVQLVCQRVGRSALESLYHLNLPPPEEWEDPDTPPSAYNLLQAYGALRGFMSHKGNPDRPRTARYVLKDYVNGKLLFCHPPPGIDGAAFQKPPYREPRPQSSVPRPSKPMKTEFQMKSEALVQEFFTQKHMKPHALGPRHKVDGYVRTEGLQSVGQGQGEGQASATLTPQGSQTSVTGKPWKRHNNRNKKEKLRRVYKDHDTY